MLEVSCDVPSPPPLPAPGWPSPSLSPDLLTAEGAALKEGALPLTEGDFDDDDGIFGELCSPCC